MTPVSKARAFARRIARDLGHTALDRMRRSVYDRRQWFTSCRRCGRTLSIEPDPRGPRGEWLITGNASRMKCSTAARTYGRRKDLEAL